MNENVNVFFPVEAIRFITGLSGTNVKGLGERLAICNLICRVIMGDADKEFADEIILKKFGFKIEWGKL